jgi:molybdate transport system substrate-binding protein
MSRKNVAIWVLPLLLMVSMLFPSTNYKASAETDGTLLVYSGGGMKGPMDEMGELFGDRYDVEVEYLYADSGDLLSQIESSEEGDVFMPGGMHYFDLAKDEEFIEYEKYVAYHTPVIAVQEENPKHIDSIEDLTRPGIRVALGDAEACAIGKISEKILENAEISEEVEENVVTYTSTVNEAVLCVVEQESDAAIVWRASLVEFEDETDMVEIAEEINEIDIIPIGTLIFSENKALARKFVDFVVSEEGKEVFEEWGFEPYS